MSKTYRYKCSQENAVVYEVKSTVPTVCKNDGATLVAGTVCMVEFPLVLDGIDIESGGDVTGISHTALSDIGSNTHAAIDTHIANAAIHRQINDAAAGATDLWSASNITTQLATKAASSALSSHTGDATIHFTQAAINHASILNIGTNTHAQIDTHIAGNSAVHGVTGAIVGNTDVQTLSNKSLVDANTVIVNTADATKAVKFSAGGATTATTTTLAFSQTANRTVTYPNATDTLVGKSTTDTLSNKSLVDANTLIVNTVDGTKAVKFSNGGATAATSTTLTFTQTADRIITYPNATDTLVGRATTDTFSNKSMVDANTLIVNTTDATKAVKFSTGGATTATTTTLAFATTANRTVTFPDGTDTLVGRATTDTLSNKSLVDANTFIVNTSDATKTVKFSTGAATTATTTTLVFAPTTNRTVTFPDGSDTLVGRATIDTLTNKSLVDGNTLIVNITDATKTVKFATGGSTEATTTTLAFAQTADRTVTYPNATDTLVGRATTDTLSNKSLVDATTLIVNTTDATKAVKFSNSGATSATTMILAFTQTANRTVTCPDATDTLVGKATIDTLSNKSLVDASTFIVNATDATKTVKFSTGGATAATVTTLAFAQTANRTVTYPDGSDTLVGKATADTLTNKTLTGNTNTIRATQIATTGSDVVVSAAAAPTVGQFFFAPTATTAAWTSLVPVSVTEVSVTVSTSTTSTTFVAMSGMTVTPASGNYLVAFNSTCNINSASGFVTYTLYVGGVALAASNRVVLPATTTGKAVISTVAKVTVNGSQMVEVWYKTSTGTCNVYERVMEIIKTV